MGLKPIQLNFNAGELSPLMAARADLPVNAFGCETLENMLATPMGPSFRRPGTEYIATTKSNGAARLVPFVFSDSDAYILEVGDEYIRFYRNGGQILDGDDPYELATSFDVADVFEIQHEQTADLMYMVHNDYWPQKLTRSGHTSWTIEDMDVVDGPFLEGNITDVTMEPSALTGSITLTASAATFNANHVGALWRLTQNRAGTVVSGTFSANGNSDNLAIERGGQWKVVSHGTWSGTITVERSYDAGTTWEYVTGGSYVNDGNIIATGRETQQDAVYRAKMTGYASGSCKYNLNALDYEWDSVVKITAYTSTTVVTATVLDPMPLMVVPTTTVTSVNDARSSSPSHSRPWRHHQPRRRAKYRIVRDVLQTVVPTKRWAEGAWSPYRGHPSAITFFQQRLALASSGHRLPRIWLSESYEFEHFNDGILDTDGMTFTLATARQDPIMWLVDQKNILIGTSGAEHSLGPPAGEGAMVAGEFETFRHDTIASALIQPVLLNNSVIFVEKGGRRLRQISYSYNDNGYTVENLSVLAEHITDSGIIQIAVQRRPMTIIWAVLTDGTLLSLNYDRIHKILAWARHPMTNGSVESVAVIPGDDEDEVWLIVNRTIGGTKRYVERIKPHDWGDDDEDAFFVDSGLTFDGGAAQNITNIAMAGGEITVTVDTWPTDGDGDDLADDDWVKLVDIEGTTELNDLVFTVSDADSTAKTFKLRNEGDTAYWDGDAYTAYASGGTVQKVQKTFTTLSHLAGQTVSINVDGYVEDDQVVAGDGSLTLSDWANTVHIGLPFTSKLTTNDIELMLGDGSTRGRKKRISSLILDLYKTGSCKFGRDSDNLIEIDFREYDDDVDSFVPLFTGVRDEEFNGIHTRNARIAVVQDKPLPLTVRALIPRLTID